MTSFFGKLFRASPAALILGLALTGCQKGGETVEGSTRQSLLASRAVSPGDLAYMRRLTASASGGAWRLDLADDVQYRFLRARMAASGKTPESAPQFFATLEGLRQKHLARKQGGGAPDQLANSGDKDHMISSFTVLPDGKTFELTAFSTVHDGTDYSFVDAVLWDSDQGTQLSDYGWGEAFDDGRKLKARATGLLPTGTDNLFFADSLELVSRDGEEEVVYVNKEVKTPPGGSITHPSDSNNDKIITSCLDRNYGDCDYPLVGKWEVQIPLKGSITFPYEVLSIDQDSANTYVKLVEESGGPRHMTFGPISNYLKINPDDRRQVTWDVPQAQGIFAGILFQRYEDVDYFMAVKVTMKRPAGPGSVAASAMISSVAAKSSPAMPVVPKIQIVYSCLAQGTEIRMAGGKTTKIEAVTKQTQVLSGGAGQALAVVDTSVGIERIPMVRLVDDAGHNLLLTGSHPVLTPTSGVRWAEELKVGDQVLTESGVQKLVKADREMFHGNVYNLKLDTSTVEKPEFARGSSMFANGFLVGDLAMQRAFEFKNRDDRAANVLARLPSRWHADYLNSLAAVKPQSRP